jgi:hypothetical protein
MSMSSRDLRQMVEGALSAEFLERAVKGLALANRETARYCSRFAAPERSGVFGHLERAHTQTSLREAARQTAGMEFRSRANEPKTAFYTVVRSAGVLLTSSAVQSPGQMPRAADYRNSIALNPQVSLFDFFEREVSAPTSAANDDGSVFGIITHSRNNKFELVDVRIVVPDSGNTYSLCTIHLGELLAQALDEQKNLAPEESISEVEPELLNEETDWESGKG